MEIDEAKRREQLPLVSYKRQPVCSSLQESCAPWVVLAPKEALVNGRVRKSKSEYHKVGTDTGSRVSG